MDMDILHARQHHFSSQIDHLRFRPDQRLDLAAGSPLLQGEERRRAGRLQQALAHGGGDGRGRCGRVTPQHRHRDGSPRCLDDRTLTHAATLTNRAPEGNRSQVEGDPTSRMPASSIGTFARREGRRQPVVMSERADHAAAKVWNPVSSS